MNDPTFIAAGIIQFLVLLFSLSIHECAHAATAFWLGDDTASLQGRLTLNPLSHIDPVGTLVLPLIGIFTGFPVIGWARPVPTNPLRYRKYRSGQILVAAAGPGSNLCLATVFLVAWVLYVHVLFPALGTVEALAMLCQYGVLLNILLAAFNLLPLPPLDGSWIASHGLPREIGNLYDEWIAPNGMWILLGLFALGVLNLYLRPFVAVGNWLLRLALW